MSEGKVFRIGSMPVQKEADGAYTAAVQIFVRWDKVKVFIMPTLMLIDYDMPSDRHIQKQSVTGRSLDHLWSILQNADDLWEEYGLPNGPAEWRVHRTAGGYHAFRMDAEVEPGASAAGLIKRIGGDPGYATLVNNTKEWPIRVSKKYPDESDIYTVVHAGEERRFDLNCLIQLKLYQQLCDQHAAVSASLRD